MSQLSQKARKQDGFTLVELIVVVAILGILAAVLTPRVLDAVENARISAAETSAKQIQLAMERYLIAENNYPTEDAILDPDESADETSETLLRDLLADYTNLDPNSFTIQSYVGFSQPDGTGHVTGSATTVKFYHLEILFDDGEVTFLITPNAVTLDGTAADNE